MRTPPPLLLASCSIALFALGCAQARPTPRAAPGVTLASITVTSPAFTAGGRIPVDYTCDGKDVMPELVLSAPPENTRSLAIVIDDPDAPSGRFVHMVAFDLPPDLHRLAGPELPEGARFALNDAEAARYTGPCPPKGEAHRYRFRAVALNTRLDLPEGAPYAQVDDAMDGHVIGEGVLTGIFGH